MLQIWILALLGQHYLLFGESILPDVLANFDADLSMAYSAVISDVVRVSYVAHLMLVFPIIFHALRLTQLRWSPLYWCYCCCLHQVEFSLRFIFAGESIKVVSRFSLPDVDRCRLLKNAGVYQFPRVSCSAASAKVADLDLSIAGYGEMPGYEQIFTEFLFSLAQKSKHQWYI